MEKIVGRISLCIVVLIILFMVVPSFGLASGTTGVSRSVANNGSDFDVTIKINDSLPVVVGITETLPDGCSFVSTSLPADQFQISGNKLMFAAVNVTEFKYTVKGVSPSGSTGTWIDMLGDLQGEIGKAGTTTSGGDSQGGSNSTPGFEALVALVALGGIVLFARKM
jgi:hypothetical protein